MNSLASKGLIVERLSIQTDNSQLKPTNPISQIKKHTNQLIPIGKAQLNCLANLIKLGLMGVGLLALPLSGYAAISATTSKTIQGSEPYLVWNGIKITSTDDLLGFSFPDGSGGIKKITVNDALGVIQIPNTVKHNEINPIMLPDISNNFRSLNSLLSTTPPQLTVLDDDGDDIIGASALGKIKVTFLKDGVPIIPTNKLFSICDSSVYSLEIELDTSSGADVISAKTRYGDPDKKEYTGSISTVTYQFEPKGNPQICRIKTADMTVHSSQSATKFPYIDASNPGGYNQNVWAYNETSGIHEGFDVDNLKILGIDFPTTGFQQAQLTIEGSGGNQSLYSCDISGGGWVTQSGNGCTLTYNTVARPTTGITIQLKNLTGTVIDSYVIPAPTLWAGTGKWDQFSSSNTFTTPFYAANYCSGRTITTKATALTYFFTSAQLTNTPRTGGSYFSRDADGSFMGEWGDVSQYSSASWPAPASAISWNKNRWMWTSEPSVTTSVLSVSTLTGNFASNTAMSTAVFAVCKK